MDLNLFEYEELFEFLRYERKKSEIIEIPKKIRIMNRNKNKIIEEIKFIRINKIYKSTWDVIKQSTDIVLEEQFRNPHIMDDCIFNRLTEKEKEFIIKLHKLILDVYKNGYNFIEISPENINKDNEVDIINEYRKRRGKENLRWSEDDIQNLKDMWDRKKTIRNMANKLQRTTSAVIRKLKQIGYINVELRHSIHKRVCQDCMRSLNFKEVSALDRKKQEELCFECYMKKNEKTN